MENIIKEHPVIAILRHTPDRDLAAYTASLYEGGIRAFEVSLSTEDALSQLLWMKQNMPKDTCIGAGTVLSVSDARAAKEAGADFLLSPSVCPKVLEYCKANKISFLPGVFSPTDVAVCLSFGYRTLKLFPAGDLPSSYIKSLRGPFPEAEFVAVGGISPKNAVQYFKKGFQGVGIGSALADQALFQQKNWSEITKNISNFMTSLRKEGFV